MTQPLTRRPQSPPSPATQLDLYQLTSLIPHWDAGLAGASCWMSFFSRRLPRELSGAQARPYIVWAGLQRCMSYLRGARFQEEHLHTLCAHPILGPALKARPALLEALRSWRFRGELWGPQEGTLIWANPAQDEAGELLKGEVQPSASLPYLQVKCDLLSAKLIETPLLSIINHMSMVASKSAQLCAAAEPKQLYEFGSRRTHPEAAVDAAYAAYIGGSAATSNLEAHHRYGVPVVGTMDHFAVQAWERPELSVAESERAFFKAFYETYPEQASLLIDTYDPFGAETGIRNAVAATGGALKGIRLDSMLSVDTLSRARALLDELGATEAKIIASGGIDLAELKAFKEAPVDAFGVGERLVSSADAPVGVGAVGKLSSINGLPTMKQAKGTGKATLPGPLQCYRSAGLDRLALLNPAAPQSGARSGETALIELIWDAAEAEPPERDPSVTRDFVITQRGELKRAGLEARTVVLDEALIALVKRLLRT